MGYLGSMRHWAQSWACRECSVEKLCLIFQSPHGERIVSLTQHNNEKVIGPVPVHLARPLEGPHWNPRPIPSPLDCRKSYIPTANYIQTSVYVHLLQRYNLQIWPGPQRGYDPENLGNLLRDCASSISSCNLDRPSTTLFLKVWTAPQLQITKTLLWILGGGCNLPPLSGYEIEL